MLGVPFPLKSPDSGQSLREGLFGSGGFPRSLSRGLVRGTLACGQPWRKEAGGMRRGDKLAHWDHGARCSSGSTPPKSQELAAGSEELAPEPGASAFP